MPKRSFICTYVDEEHGIIHVYEYRGYQYKVYEDNEMTDDMQKQFEEQAIDYLIDEVNDAREFICSL